MPHESTTVPRPSHPSVRPRYRARRQVLGDATCSAVFVHLTGLGRSRSGYVRSSRWCGSFHPVALSPEGRMVPSAPSAPFRPLSAVSQARRPAGQCANRSPGHETRHSCRRRPSSPPKSRGVRAGSPAASPPRKRFKGPLARADSPYGPLPQMDQSGALVKWSDTAPGDHSPGAVPIQGDRKVAEPAPKGRPPGPAPRPP